MRIKGSIKLKTRDIVYLFLGIVLMVLALQQNYETVAKIIFEWFK